MAFASVMTFSDPDECVRVQAEHDRIYIYWQTATYVALTTAEARTVLDGIAAGLAKLEAEPQQVTA